MPRNFTRLAVLSVLATASMAFGLAGPGNKVKPPEDGPRGLTASIVANKDTYTLDPAQSGKEFADRMKKMGGNGPAVGGGMGGAARPPASPAVDLVLRISNPTDKSVTIVVGGDASVITLDLKGPGAVTIEPPMAMTMEFRMGKSVTIDAGKSTDIPITSLTAGQRGMTQMSYWTEAGDYTLAATFLCHDDQGVGTKVTTDPAKLKVAAK